jgi:hypothetical protein
VYFSQAESTPGPGAMLHKRELLGHKIIIGEIILPSYKLAYDKSISDELKKRFASEIAYLETEEFSSFSLHQEIIHPFSLLTFFPIYLAMRMGNEIIQIQSPLRITSFHLMYASQKHSTYAYVYGLGCKFYTNFTDGSWLVSNTHQKIKNKAVTILRGDPEHTSPDQIWKRHQEKISELETQGKQINPHISFDAWVKLEQQFDQGGLPSMIATGFIWLLWLTWILYWLVNKVLSIVNVG